jgi:hypothetical protein
VKENDFMSEPQLKAFRRENIPAYGAVMGTWLALSAALAASAAVLGRSRKPSFGAIFVFGLIAVMAGMGIMFTASLLNLRKMRSGFERLAAGDPDPDIPPVWCPVLTTATQAATHLAHGVGEQREADRKP